MWCVCASVDVYVCANDVKGLLKGSSSGKVEIVGSWNSRKVEIVGRPNLLYNYQLVSLNCLLYIHCLWIYDSNL